MTYYQLSNQPASEPAPATVPNRFQKAIQTTILRAATLFSSGGYKIDPYGERPGIYCVARGENDKRRLQKGELPFYDVDIVHQDCTCPAFEFRGTCKHLIAVNDSIASAYRLLAPLLPAAMAEHTRTSDPRTEDLSQKHQWV